MKTKKKMQISLAAVLLLVCGAAFAYTSKQEPAAMYFGFQPGYANMHYTKECLKTPSIDITNIGSVDSSGFAGRFYVGYDFNKNFGMEVGYVFLPKIKFNNVNALGYLPFDASFNQNIFDFCAKATLPLKYNIDLYGKAGAAIVVRDDFELSTGGQTAEADSQDTETVPAIGAGVDYGFNDHVFADLSYMHYFGKNDLQATDFVGIGLIYRI